MGKNLSFARLRSCNISKRCLCPPHPARAANGIGYKENSAARFDASRFLQILRSGIIAGGVMLQRKS